jgi:hypothetical protein
MTLPSVMLFLILRMFFVKITAAVSKRRTKTTFGKNSKIIVG